MTKYITFGAILGGVIGWLVGHLQWLTFGSLTLVGIFLGGVVGWIIGLYFNRNISENINSHLLSDKPSRPKLELKEEQLEITKNKIVTGEVNVYKEIVEEQKNVTIPVNHEELVIEKYEVHGNEKEKKEEIRIPLTEEKVVISKHPVKVAEVSISKKNITEMKQIQETLKKEQVNYEVIGQADVNDGDSFKEQR